MSSAEQYRYYQPRSTFIDGIAVDETAVFDVACDEHVDYAEQNADVINDNYLAIASAREEALCREEIERDGKTNPRRKNEVARVQEERPRVLAMLHILYDRVRVADDAVYAAVRAEAPGHVDAAKRAVYDAVQVMEAAYAEADKAKAAVRAAMEHGDQVIRWGANGGRPDSFHVVSDMWSRANMGTTDEQFRMAARRIVAGFGNAGQGVIAEVADNE